MTIILAKCMDHTVDIMDLEIGTFNDTHNIPDGSTRFEINMVEIWLDLKGLEALSNKLARIVKINKEFNVKRLIDTKLNIGDLEYEIEQQEG